MKRNGYVRILLSILFALLLSNTIPIMASADEIIVTEEVSFDEGDSDTLEEVWEELQEENQAGEELPEESQANEELQEESQTDEELQEDTQVDEELPEESQAGEELQGESQDAANPLTGDVSFDALIEPEIVITYDGNGGTYIAADGSEAPTKSVKYAKGFVEDGLFWPTSPTGKRFIGYSSTRDGSDLLTYDKTIGGYFIATESRTYYAVWEAGARITFNANGGLFSNNNQETIIEEYEANTRLHSYPDLKEREGYAFVGWSTTPGGAPLPFDSDGFFTAKEDTTLYAVWKNAYKIIFDANGGTFYKGTVTTTNYYADAGEILNGYVKPDDRDGYVFAGWSTDRSGSPLLEYDEALGGYYKATGDATLYAVWKKACRITFDANGGTFNKGTETTADFYVGSGEMLNDFLSPDARDGYLLDGWSTNQSGSPLLEYDEALGGYYKVTGDATLYAVWKKAYKIIFDANGGTFFKGTETTSITYAQPGEILLGVTPDARDGYVLVGWSTDRSGSPLLEYDKMLDGYYTATGDATLYAVWKKGCRITFDANGGTFYKGTETTTVFNAEPGEMLQGSVEPDERKGYVFAGWSTNQSGSPLLEYDKTLGGYYKVTGDATLYAVWKKACKVTFDANGGVFNDGSKTQTQSMEKNSVLSSYPYPEERANQLFMGWNTKKNATTGLEYDRTIEGYLRLTDDITLYAVWSSYYKIIFDANGGTFYKGTETTTVFNAMPGEILQGSVEPDERDGYVLAGWSTKRSGSPLLEYDKTLGGYYKATGNATLYAVWKKACTITFKANGGSFVGGGTTAQLKVEINKGLSIWPPDDGSDGKLLKGWSLDSSGKQFLEAGENGVYYTPTGDATLYAVWYKAITFDANGGTFRNGKTKKDYMYADVGDVFRGDMEPDDRKGYILDGWSTKRTGKSLKYNDSLGGYFKVTGDITLYAVWKEACTISFNANGGRFMDGSKTKELKLKKNVYLNYYPALAKDGKKAFIGWNYKPTDKKALEYNMDQDGFLKVTKNVTLYAIWSDVKVTLNKTKASVNVGNSVNLVASVTPNEAGQGVIWKSSNTKVATVTAKGVVKGLKKGKATITAAAKNGSGASAVCTVSVLQPVTKIKLNKTSGTVKAGKSITLKVTVTPDAASNKAVVWKSSNTKVATVTQKGVVKGVKAGTAKITVTAKDGSGKKATCKITVK